MLEKFKSRKFLIALAGVVIFVLNDVLGLHFDVQTVSGIVGSIIAYIVGEGIVDKGRATAEIKAESEFWRQEATAAKSKFWQLKEHYEKIMGEAPEAIPSP